MNRTIVCHGCDERLAKVSNAMRHHASVMQAAIKLAKGERDLTEEQRKDFTNSLVASFNDAQSAWDVYREHLIEHGVLPASPSSSLIPTSFKPLAVNRIERK